MIQVLLIYIACYKSPDVRLFPGTTDVKRLTDLHDVLCLIFEHFDLQPGS